MWSSFSKKKTIKTFVIGFACLLFCGFTKIGHRGASGYLPEHTLSSYTAAYFLGADYIEPDLVLTKDNEFICLHDIDLSRTTNVKTIFPNRGDKDGRFLASHFTLKEIKQLLVHERVGSDGKQVFPGRFPAKHAIFRIPTLGEVLALIGGLNHSTGRNVGIYPEIKRPTWHESIGLPMEERLLAALKPHPHLSIFIQAFESAPLKKLAGLMHTTKQKIPLVQLVWDKDWEYGTIGQPFSQTLNATSLAAVARYARGIAPHKSRIVDNAAIVELAHANKLFVHPYTFRADQLAKTYKSVDEEIKHFREIYKVDGVFTDFPDVPRQF